MISLSVLVLSCSEKDRNLENEQLKRNRIQIAAQGVTTVSLTPSSGLEAALAKAQALDNAKSSVLVQAYSFGTCCSAWSLEDAPPSG